VFFRFILMMSKKSYLLLCFATFFVFFGRGIQYCYNDAPFRVLVWDEDLMKPLLEHYFSMSWEDWTLNPENENRIIAFAKIIGYLFFSGAVAALLLAALGAFAKEESTILEIRNPKKYFIFIFISKILVFICFINLIILYLLYCKDKSYRPTEFLEYALQWGTPFLLLFHSFFTPKIFYQLVKILCVAVFVSHGLYALGIFTTPVSYISMTINGLHISESAAIVFLKTVGVLDILFSVGIFFPKTLKISVLYFIVWGFLTTVARLYCNWYSEMWELSVQQYFYEMLVRFPHFLMPILILNSKF
jgi:hypothetical protein